jgi:inorganic pyrophosphatase
MNTGHFDLTALDEESGELNVIIETAKGSRNKFNFDEKRGIFKLGGVLPAGAVFPFDFGFVPATLGEDGDPLDVLVLMDEPAFAGCWVPSRLIGLIKAEQTERDGETMRNDRLIAVAANSHTHRDIRELSDLSSTLVEEIEHFFVSYNAIRDKKFKPLARYGAKRAKEVVREGVKRSQHES